MGCMREMMESREAMRLVLEEMASIMKEYEDEIIAIARKDPNDLLDKYGNLIGVDNSGDYALGFLEGVRAVQNELKKVIE